MNVRFKVYYKYTYGEEYDMSVYDDVMLELTSEECQRLVAAKASGIPFHEAESVNDIYNRVIQECIERDRIYYMDHIDSVSNLYEYLEFLAGYEPTKRSERVDISCIRDVIHQFVENNEDCSEGFLEIPVNDEKLHINQATTKEFIEEMAASIIRQVEYPDAII